MLDSGSTDHLTGDSMRLDDYREVCTPRTITVIDGSTRRVAGVGHARLDTEMGFATLHDDLHVPGLDFNPASVMKWTREARVLSSAVGDAKSPYTDESFYEPSCKRACTRSEPSHCVGVALLRHGRQKRNSSGRLARVVRARSPSHHCEDDEGRDGGRTRRRWEGAHLFGEGTLWELHKGEAAAQRSFLSSKTVNAEPMELVHTDVMLMPQMSRQGAKYVLTLLDDFSRA
jgi:hypothetical protein